MFKNIKKTWWILLLIYLILTLFTFEFIGLDYVLTHEDQFTDFLYKVNEYGHTYKEIIMIMHYSQCMFMILGLLLSALVTLTKLFIKKNKME